MASNRAAVIVPLIIIVLLTAHLSQDIVYGLEPGGLSELNAAAIAGIWLYFSLAHAGRRLGYLLLLIASFLAPVVALAHMAGDGVGEELGARGDTLLFVWTLLAIGATAPASCLMSIEGLWRLKRNVPGFLLWSLVPIALGAGLLGYILYRLAQ